MGCELCPRRCGADRTATKGFCGEGVALRAAKACLHFWEEPCIAGTGGAGTVFLTGCNLGCVYCQNRAISRGGVGKEITEDRLSEIIDDLVWQGADTVEFVTPTHFIPQIAAVLGRKKPPVPVVYNSGGYDSPAALKLLEGLIDVYLPDYKYADASLAAKLSRAPDYPAAALAAIQEMFRQTGPPRFDQDGMLLSGVLVRHMVLPGFVENTLDCIDRLFSVFSPDEIVFSLMSQYTPPAEPLPIPSLNRRLTEAEYDRAVDYLYLNGIENGFVQELSSAEAEYTPDFDLSGL